MSGVKRAQEPEAPATVPALSKRGARRAIQRAFVLAGRERAIRQHLRNASFTILWIIEDWGLEWTAICDRGRIEFHRGRAGKPQLTYTWVTAEDFLARFEPGKTPGEQPQLQGDLRLRRLAEPVFDAFMDSLHGVLTNPVDDEGERLI